MRLIPARAGNILTDVDKNVVKPAHPRSRGEHGIHSERKPG